MWTGYLYNSIGRNCSLSLYSICSSVQFVRCERWFRLYTERGGLRCERSARAVSYILLCIYVLGGFLSINNNNNNNNNNLACIAPVYQRLHLFAIIIHSHNPHSSYARLNYSRWGTHPKTLKSARMSYIIERLVSFDSVLYIANSSSYLVTKPFHGSEDKLTLDGTRSRCILQQICHILLLRVQ